MDHKRHAKQRERRNHKHANNTLDPEFVNLEFADENDFVKEDDLTQMERRNERRYNRDEYN